jgi:hypothetical protein
MMAAFRHWSCGLDPAARRDGTIQVAHGTDKEEVLMGKPLSLIGQHAEKTIIDATGPSDGIDIDGIDRPCQRRRGRVFRGSI